MAHLFHKAYPSEMIGKTDLDLFSADHAFRAMEDERRIIETGIPAVNVEEEETWPDGHTTWVSSTKMVLRDEAGKVIGTFGISRDITQRKEAERELARVAAELRGKNQALEEDLEMARELQNALLPQRFPCFPRGSSETDSVIHFHHFYRPSSTVGGDFFDVFEIDENVAGLFICDVMGHGVRAALVASILRALLNELQPVWKNPSEFMAQLNRALRRILKHTRVPALRLRLLRRGGSRRRHAYPCQCRASLPLASPWRRRAGHSAAPGWLQARSRARPAGQPELPLLPNPHRHAGDGALFYRWPLRGRSAGWHALRLQGAYPGRERAGRAACGQPVRGHRAQGLRLCRQSGIRDDVCLIAMEIDRLAPS